MVGRCNEQLLYIKVATSWIQSFAQRFRIVNCTQKGTYHSNHEKEFAVDVNVVHHLCTWSGLFRWRAIDKTEIESSNKTHFVINVDYRRTLEF